MPSMSVLVSELKVSCGEQPLGPIRKLESGSSRVENVGGLDAIDATTEFSELLAHEQEVATTLNSIETSATCHHCCLAHHELLTTSSPPPLPLKMNGSSRRMANMSENVNRPHLYPNFSNESKTCTTSSTNQSSTTLTTSTTSTTTTVVVENERSIISRLDSSSDCSVINAQPTRSESVSRGLQVETADLINLGLHSCEICRCEMVADEYRAASPDTLVTSEEKMDYLSTLEPCPYYFKCCIDSIITLFCVTLLG